MKLRQISFKIISMIMVLAMMFGVCATTISAIVVAEEHDHNQGNDTENKAPIYVSLGDSMTNGYGLPGYDGNTGVNDYGNGSYANQFADYVGADKHYQLAMSAMRVEDLHWLLEVDYNDPKVIEVIQTLDDNHKFYENTENLEAFNELWYSVFTTGDFWTWKELVDDYRLDVAAYCIEGKDKTDGGAFNADYRVAYDDYTDVESLQLVAKYYQDAVAEADIISLGIGNGNFGVYMFGRILEAIGFSGEPADAMIYQVENAIRELDPVMQAKILSLKAEITATLNKAMAEQGMFGEEATEALINTMVYTTLSFVLNYMGTVDALVELNGDADIIFLALMNTFAGDEKNFPLDLEDANNIINGEFDAMGTLTQFDLGDLLQLVYVPLNAFIAAYPTYLQFKGQIVEGAITEVETNLQNEIAKIEAEANAQVEALTTTANAKIEALNAQLKTATGLAKISIQSEINKIKAELENEINAITNQAKLDSSAVIENVGRQLGIKSRAKTVCEDIDLEALKAESDAYVAELVAQAEAQIVVLNATVEEQLVVLNAMLQGVVGEAKVEIEAQIVALEAARDEAIAYVEAELAAKIAEAEVLYNAAKVVLEAQYAEAVAVLEAELAEQLAALAVAYAEAKAVVNAEMEALMEELANEIEEAVKAEIMEAIEEKESLLAHLEEKYADEIAALEEVFGDEIAAVEAELAVELGKYDAILSAEITAFEAQAQAEINAKIAEAEAQIAILEAQLTIITEDAKAQIEILKAELEQAIATAKAAAEAQIAELEAQAELAVGEAKAALEAQIAAVKAEYNRVVEAIVAEYEATIAELHAFEAQVKAEIYAEIARIQAEYEAAVNAINAKLTDAINSANDVIKAEIDSIENAIVAEIDKATAELNATVATINTVLTSQISALKADAEAKVAEAKKELIGDVDATNNRFFYAESDEIVSCMVDVYADEIYTNEIVRSRFVESIVGTASNPGMIWGLLGLASITLADIEAYEALTASEKIDFAANNYAKAYPIIVYLAFEQAILESVDGASVSVESILGLGSLNLDASAIIDGMGVILEDMKQSNLVKDENGQHVSDEYFKPAGKYVDDTLTATLNGYLVNFGIQNYKNIDLATLWGTLQYAMANGLISQTDAMSLLALYIFKTNVSGTASAVRFPATAKKKMIAAFESIGFDKTTATAITEGMYTQVADGFDGAYSALATKDALAESVLANKELAGLLSLFATCVIGNGLGSHPSQAGHDTLFAAVKECYDNEYTTLDETIENLIIVGGILAALGAEYYDEAYAYAYAELKAEGVIDDIIGQLEAARTELANLKAELKAIDADAEYATLIGLLADEIDLTDATIVKVIELLGEEELTSNTWALIEGLANNLVAHAYKIVEIANELTVIGEAHTEALISDVLAELAVIKAELEARATEQIEIAVAEINAKIDELQAHVSEQIAILEAEATARLEQLYAELETATGEAYDTLVAEINRVEAELAANIAELQAAIDAEIATLTAELDAKISAINADLNSVIDAIVAEYEARIAAIEAEYAALEALINEIIDTINDTIDAYNWLSENLDDLVSAYVAAKLDEIYSAFVEAAVAAFNKYASEAAEWAYNWLLENPETVVEFFYENGEDILDFIVEYNAEIFIVLGFIALNYGEDIFNLVVDNADVVLPATCKLVKVYGEVILPYVGVYVLDLINEYYDDAYEYAHAQLVEAGVIDEITIALLDQQAEILEHINALDNMDLDEQYTVLRDLLAAELDLLYFDLESIIVLINKETIDAETWAILEDLSDSAANHSEMIKSICAEIDAIGNAHVEELIGNINASIDDIINALNKLESDMNALVDALLSIKAEDVYNYLINYIVETIKEQAPLAADWIYNWLYNNPDKVIAFFQEYGDDMVEFIAENNEIIIGLITFIALNYGDEILNYVLDNADVILVALVNWIDVHGENTIKLIAVYLDALGINLDYELDLEHPEKLLNDFYQVIVLLGQLAEMVVDGAIDILDALNLTDDVQAALAALEAYLTDAAQAYIAQLRAFADAQIEALINAANAKIAELQAALESAVGAGRDAILAEIARIQAELAEKIAEINASVEAQIAAIDAKIKAAIENAAKLLAESVNDFVVNELGDILIDIAKTYGPEVAEFIYNWVKNNPDKILEFFNEYGDDIFNFLNDHSEEISKILNFIIENYGDEILEFVLDNADVILVALVDWIKVYGDDALELIKVYLDAMGIDLSLNIDFCDPQAIIDAFSKIIYLVKNLNDMIYDGVYDYLEALNLVEQVEAALAELKAYLINSINEKIDALEAFVNAKIEAIKAEIQAQIDKAIAKFNAQVAAIRAEIEAKIAALKAELAFAIGEAKARIEAEIARLEALLEAEVARLQAMLDAQIAALQAELEARIAAELEKLAANAEELKAALIVVVKDIAKDVYGVIEGYVDDAVTGEYTPSENSYYTSVNGGDALYAVLLAQALGLELGNTTFSIGQQNAGQVGFTTWDNIDYEMLAKSDLVTIGFDQNELSDFAVDQLLGYLVNFADVKLRNNLNGYIASVFEKLEGKVVLGEYEDVAYVAVNTILDEILAYELIAGKQVQTMDWAALVGAENVRYVDEARETIKAELIASGVMDTYVFSMDVVEYIYANSETLGLTSVTNFITKDYMYEILGESAIYSIEIPVVDSLVFAAESYLYNYVSFNVAYGQLIVDLYKINPEATVVLLGHYNAFANVAFEMGDISVDLGAAYEIVSGVSSIQPYAYALLSSKVAYVDISDAETVYDSYVNAGIVDNDLLSFLMLYLNDSSITDISEEGQYYVFQQIMDVLVIGCDHEYDNACDADCNKCGQLRDVPGHIYDNACDATCNVCGFVRVVSGHVYSGCSDPTCNICGATRPAPGCQFDNCADMYCNVCGALRTDAIYGHVYDDCHDTECNICGETRPAGEHAFDDCRDTTCWKCDYVREALDHVYDNCEDTTCNNCGKERVALDHVYDNACDADCNVCGVERQVEGHVYSGCEDVNCNICGATREAGTHKTTYCTDAVCEVCGQAVEVKGHSFGEWTVVREATKKVDGEKTRKCNNCGYTETITIAAISGGLSVGAIVAIVIGSIVVAGAAGFAIYWFIIQKKTFAALMAVLAGSSEEAPAEAEEAEAEVEKAPETENQEETK